MAFGLYKASSKDWLVFILGLLTMIKIRLLGTFGVSELIMFGLLIIKAKENPFFQNRQAKTLFVLAILWAAGTLFTDVYRGSSDIDMAKGLFSVVFLILILPVAYWCLYDRVERVMYFMGGLAISAILNFYFQGNEEWDEFDVDVWQVYAFEYLAVFLSALMFYRKGNSAGYLILFVFGIWSLFHMSRNVFLVFVISAVLIYVTLVFWKKAKENPIKAQTKFDRNIPAILLILSLSFIGIKDTYEHLASDGTLGMRAKAKYEMQKNSSLGLMSGRSDFFISWQLVKESLIIGYGSYAKDKDESAYQKSRKLGLEKNSAYLQNKVRQRFLPGHSHILGAWVYNGILGLPFWLYAIWIIISFFRRGLYKDISITPVLIIWSVIMFWDILFSPYANRPVIALFLAALVALQGNSRKKISNANEIVKYGKY